MRRLLLAAILSLPLVPATGCILPIYSGDQPHPDSRIDLHVRKPAAVPGGMATHLVPGSAEPFVALSHAWRHDLTPPPALRQFITGEPLESSGRLAFFMQPQSPCARSDRRQVARREATDTLARRSMQRACRLANVSHPSVSCLAAAPLEIARVSSPAVDLSVSPGPAATWPTRSWSRRARLAMRARWSTWSISAAWAASFPRRSRPSRVPATHPGAPSRPPAGMLNSIGLDNDGIEAFIAHHLPYLAGLASPIVVSIAGHDLDEFVAMAARLDGLAGVAAIELNVSCPNVSGGVDFGTDPAMCRRVVERRAGRLRPADSCQADAQRHQTSPRSPGPRPTAGRGRHFGHQHLPGHGRRLAQAATAAGQRHGRAERPGDQADRPAVRLPGGPGGRRFR